MIIPEIKCQIEAYCSINPSEDPKKIKHALSNILTNIDLQITNNSLKAVSNNLESLSKIFETIHSRKAQKNYGRQLNSNLIDNSTWFYLNRQAAFVNTIALCADSEESPLGPIKVIIISQNIERVIDWLISY